MISRIIHFSLGFSIILLLSLLISNNPKKIKIYYIIQILIIEIILGYFILHSEIGLEFTKKLCFLFDSLLFFASEGINFVFKEVNSQKQTNIFFLNALCPIIVISAFIGILQYLNILKYFIRIIGTILSKISGMGKLESFNIISSLILGQSENFIIYKNIIQHISEARIYTMAVTSMSTVSLSVISIYMTILEPKYIVTALILNMFSTCIVVSVINPYINNSNKNLYLHSFNANNHNFFEIIGEYILIGFKITMTITAMLIGFIALIATFNAIFTFLCGLSLQEVLGYIFLPLSWIIGIPSCDMIQASSIMATKLISNEFVAMINLKKISDTLSPKSIGILSIFLVSFSNLASTGIIIGAIKELNKEQSKIISCYALKLLYSSTLINLLSAVIANLII